MIKIEKLEKYILTSVISLSIGAVIPLIILDYCGKIIPIGGNLKPNSVNPSKFEFRILNLENEGKNEAVIKYNGTNYLFKPNEKGIPTACPYEVCTQKNFSFRKIK